VEPLPEVRAAFDQLAEYLQEPHDLPGQLDAVGRVSRGLVPSTVAVSISIVVDGETFTVTATDAKAGLVDAGQYLDAAGPCLESIGTGHAVLVDDVLDEDQWQTYQQASAAAGIRSSLSMPLRDDDDRITGALNVYASEARAFHGLEDVFAGVFGALAGEVVMNADLSFRTRDWARELPRRLEAHQATETAVGVLMASRDWSADQARARLRDAADRAGVQVEDVAAVVIRLAA
jgi:GAF domain-containing protein